jgi:hypothetical protein
MQVSVETSSLCPPHKGSFICAGSSVLFTVFRRICKVAKSEHQLRHVRLSAWNNSDPTGQILLKFDTWNFLENL